MKENLNKKKNWEAGIVKTGDAGDIIFRSFIVVKREIIVNITEGEKQANLRPI